ncbi:pyrroline-5-carboxylate reductase [Listeria floridensis FSL S10-1187]|uniref:Pyrroline-5-carboxylate reductase n=2 Tax=Listeria floridensis TaxID=1494962 RepID=A0ABP3B121_9LIST|nr:pyrroline-5-carboxylate reductase [Listeria floridensis FSL S10-1187]
MKVGFIGVGNMASAIIYGLVKEMPAKDILIYNRTQEKAERFGEETGVTVISAAKELVLQADVVIVAVKPYVFELILPDLKSAFEEKKPLMVSIAAGLSLAQLAEFVGNETRIMRVMPNVNATIGESMSGLCGNELATAEDEQNVKSIFEAVGDVAVIPEKDFSTFAALAGSSPAFIYIFIDAMARAGVKAGLARKQALEIAAQTVLGSAKMVLESGIHPYELVDQVSSPGGTTIAGVASLMDDAFVASVMHSIEATMKREAELSE